MMYEHKILSMIGSELKKQTSRKIVIRWGDMTPLPIIDPWGSPRPKVVFADILDEWAQ